jgi:hypothetical protein
VGWTFVYLMVVLKIPIAMLGWIVWKAIHAEPEPAGDEAPNAGGGGSAHPRPRRPRPPRRGDHGEALPVPPRRIRLKGRRLPSFR